MNKTRYSYDVLEERYYDVKRIDTKKIEQLLKSGSIDMCEETVISFFEEIHFSEIKSLLMQLYVLMDLYIIIRTFTKELGIPNEDFVERYGSIDDIEKSLFDSTSVIKFFTNMLKQCIKWRIELSHEEGNDTIHKALEYINTNYIQDDVSLKSVANFVSLSPTYFSALFKKETGTNFSDYLSQIRIEKAKELLCRTTKLVSEIAYDVGFSDYRYFGQIFKKYTGQTPREFQYQNNRVV